MFAVFSVVISISGSVKYSDATHLPFSDPVSNHKRWKMLGLVKDQSQWCMKKHTKIKRACGSLQSCSQVTIMFCDSYDSKGRRKAVFSLISALSLCCSFCVFVTAWWSNMNSVILCIYIYTCAVSSYQPQSKLSRGLNGAPSSPPGSGSAVGWFPPPLWANSPWTQPPRPATVRRRRTLWTGWLTHGCYTYSSGRQDERGTSKLQTEI